MHTETGFFGGDILPDGYFSEIFRTRVIIPASEFKRLGIGRYERLSRVPACFRWCFDNFGVGGTRWSVMLRDEATAVVYFEHQQDALAFFARWSDSSVLAGSTALAA